MKTMWTANFINDPNNDFELMIEIYYKEIEIALIRKKNDSIELLFYKNNKDASIPFEWFFEIMKKANEIYS